MNWAGYFAANPMNDINILKKNKIQHPLAQQLI